MTSRLVVITDPRPRGQWGDDSLTYLQAVLAAHYSTYEVILRTEDIFPRSRYSAGSVVLEEARALPDLRKKVDTYDNLLCLTSLYLQLRLGSQAVSVGSLSWESTSIVSLSIAGGWPRFDWVASACLLELRRQPGMSY